MADEADDDRELARRMLAGEERAFERFFAGQFPRLYRFALIRLGDDADAAEEVVQATLCAAVGKLGTWRGEAPLFSWLCTFCRHEIAAFVGRRRRQVPTVPLPEDAGDIAAVLESLAMAADARAPRPEDARLVRVVLDRLPSHYCDALEWKYLDGLSVAQIAGRLRLGTKAAESLLTRARGAFRDGFAALRAGHGDHGAEGTCP